MNVRAAHVELRAPSTSRVDALDRVDIADCLAVNESSGAAEVAVEQSVETQRRAMGKQVLIRDGSDRRLTM
jgi:hypothetical protein